MLSVGAPTSNTTNTKHDRAAEACVGRNLVEASQLAGLRASRWERPPNRHPWRCRSGLATRLDTPLRDLASRPSDSGQARPPGEREPMGAVTRFPEPTSGRNLALRAIPCPSGAGGHSPPYHRGPGMAVGRLRAASIQNDKHDSTATCRQAKP